MRITLAQKDRVEGQKELQVRQLLLISSRAKEEILHPPEDEFECPFPLPETSVEPAG